jgi:hypothetical protein
MNRPILVFAMLVAAAATLAAQNQQQAPQQDPQQDQQQQPNPYAGTSAPPSDSTIQDSQPPAPTPLPKPSPAQYPQQAAPAQPSQAAPAQVPPPANSYAPANGTDSGTVQVAPDNSQPMLNQRTPVDDPDGDIVHPAPPPPGTLGYGTTIRVRLLDQLSTTESREGEPFHTRVSSDVYQNDQVLIPAGSEIDGKIVHVSTGHLGGHGSMVLHPETVILPNGTQFKMYAQLSETPGSNTRVGDEGTVAPGSRVKRDSIEYGAATGAGLVTGAVVAGPAGALAGGLIGAGAVTVHLLVNHPQARLDEGSTLVFTLTEPLDLVSALQPQPQMAPQPQMQMQPQLPAPAQGQDQSGDQAAPPDQPQPTQNQ